MEFAKRKQKARSKNRDIHHTDRNKLTILGETSIVEYPVPQVFFTFCHNVVRTEENRYKYYMQIDPVIIVEHSPVSELSFCPS